MNSEVRGTFILTKSQSIALLLITLGLALVTIVVDGKTPSDGLILIYNKMYILMLPMMAMVLVGASVPYFQANIQFGANRHKLFCAIELAMGSFYVLCAALVVAMNVVSSIIYETINPLAWDVTLLEWVYVFMVTVLIWKISQRNAYAMKGTLSTRTKVGYGFMATIGVVITICIMVVLRDDENIVLPIANQIMIWIHSVVLTGMSVAIVYLERSIYRIFMKMETV